MTWKTLVIRLLCLVVLTTISTLALAQPDGAPESPWATFIEGGAVHQLDADLDEGGSYSVIRASIEAGLAYASGPRDSIGLSLGYTADDYRFDGSTGLGGLEPWGSLHEYRVSLSWRKGFGERVDAFAIPSLRWTAESGADFGDAMTAGLIAGVNYRVSDRLRIGPGIGVFDEIEDSVNVFPILLIDWQITETLSLETGSGLGATRGPGLQLNSSAVENWTFGLGARYETYRFRLDEDGPAPDGVGEEKGVAVFLAASYRSSPGVSVSALAGLEVGGKLRLEDSEGRTIQSDDADPAPFVGFAFRARF
jgi:outer membrane receptor protein involved in Fe transport